MAKGLFFLASLFLIGGRVGASEIPKHQTTRENNLLHKSEKELREILTPLQFHVIREEGTERAFSNDYWNNKKDGIYVDLLSGEPLFSSTDKFDSKTGWPSFTRPIQNNENEIIEKKDVRWGMARTEVRSRKSEAHLGHVFQDGPEPTGLRYCINSASLRFIAKEELEEGGYGEYLKLFDKE